MTLEDMIHYVKRTSYDSDVGDCNKRDLVIQALLISERLRSILSMHPDFVSSYVEVFNACVAWDETFKE